MSRTQLLLCLFGLSSALFLNHAEAREVRRLEGEGIIGGDDVEEGQFPYQVSLIRNGDILGGGSILSERFIITAAHCVVNDRGFFRGRPLKVVAGVRDLNSKSTNRIEVDVVKVFVPIEYDPAMAYKLYKRTIGDIAILELKNALNIKTNSKLGKVKLPKKDESYEGKKAIVTGFGYNQIEVKKNFWTGEPEEADGKTFEKMRFAEANVISNDDCNIINGDDSISKQHICAAVVQHDEKQPEGVCSGDSGGPLVYKGAQIGVASVSPVGCHEDSKPAVYTRVSEYLDFIKKVVNGTTDEKIRSTELKSKPRFKLHMWL